MSFLNWPVEQTNLDQRAQQRRMHIARVLIDRLGGAPTTVGFT
jgi:hypothetical protein